MRSRSVINSRARRRASPLARAPLRISSSCRRNRRATRSVSRAASVCPLVSSPRSWRAISRRIPRRPAFAMPSPRPGPFLRARRAGASLADVSRNRWPRPPLPPRAWRRALELHGRSLGRGLPRGAALASRRLALLLVEDLLRLAQAVGLVPTLRHGGLALFRHGVRVGISGFSPGRRGAASPPSPPSAAAARRRPPLSQRAAPGLLVAGRLDRPWRLPGRPAPRGRRRRRCRAMPPHPRRSPEIGAQPVVGTRQTLEGFVAAASFPLFLSG